VIGIEREVSTFKTFICYLTITVTITASPLHAMTFQISDGSIYASGDIISGDATSLRALTGDKRNVLRRNKFGLVEMYLNSGGGNIDEAMAIFDVMDKIGVATLVPEGSSCASACASILFLSGRMRHSDGALGFHSCRKLEDSTMATYNECNARIVDFIYKHVSNSIAASFFTIITKPSGMEWINGPTAHCLGLDLYGHGYVRLGTNPCEGADQLYAMLYSSDPSKFPRQDVNAAVRQPFLMLIACANMFPIKSYLTERANYVSSTSDQNAILAWQAEHYAALQRNPACVRLAGDSDSDFEPLDANVAPDFDTQLPDGNMMHNIYVKGQVRGKIMYSTYMFASGS